MRTELAMGLYVGFVSNLALGAVLANPLRSSTRTWFVVLGVANELIGVLMIASPELLPLMTAARGWLWRHVHGWVSRLGRLIQRLLGLEPKPTFDSNTIAGHSTVSGEMEASSTPPEGADTEALVRWLVQQRARDEKRWATLEHSVSKLPARWQADISDARGELEEVTRRLVRGLAEANLVLRLLGLLFVVAGLFVSTVGNLI